MYIQKQVLIWFENINKCLCHRYPHPLVSLHLFECAVLQFCIVNILDEIMLEFCYYLKPFHSLTLLSVVLMCVLLVRCTFIDSTCFTLSLISIVMYVHFICQPLFCLIFAYRYMCRGDNIVNLVCLCDSVNLLCCISSITQKVVNRLLSNVEESIKFEGWSWSRSC